MKIDKVSSFGDDNTGGSVDNRNNNNNLLYANRSISPDKLSAHKNKFDSIDGEDEDEVPAGSLTDAPSSPNEVDTPEPTRDIIKGAATAEFTTSSQKSDSVKSARDTSENNEFLRKGQARLNESFSASLDDLQQDSTSLFAETKASQFTESVFKNFAYASEHPWGATVGAGKHVWKMLRNGTKVVQSYLDNKTRCKVLDEKVADAERVRSNDMEFAVADGGLILMSYYGADPCLVIPAAVGDRRVIAIHPNAISGGRIFNSRASKIRHGIKGGATLRSIANYSADTLHSGLVSVELPNTIRTMFGPIFKHCKELKELVIPESVVFFTNDVVAKSGIQSIYFNGKVPKSFNVMAFDGDVYEKIQERGGD